MIWWISTSGSAQARRRSISGVNRVQPNSPNASPPLRLELCGMATTWQSPVQAASSHSQSRSGRLRISTAAPPHSGTASPRKMTLRCRWLPPGVVVHSYPGKVVNTPGS